MRHWVSCGCRWPDRHGPAGSPDPGFSPTTGSVRHHGCTPNRWLLISCYCVLAMSSSPRSAVSCCWGSTIATGPMTTPNGFSDQSVAETYKRLRLMASASLIGLPLLIVLAAWLAGGHQLQPSLSDYYFAIRDGGTPRTLFVTFLAVLGCILLVYRGLDKWDDLIHNTAGFCALGVAFFPMTCQIESHPYCVPGILPKLHLPSAGLLFLSALVSVVFGGGQVLQKRLNELPSPDRLISRLRRIKLRSGALMFAGIGAFFLHKIFPSFMPGAGWIFWIEYLGYFGFGLYWASLYMLIQDANKKGFDNARFMEAAESWEPIP